MDDRMIPLSAVLSDLGDLVSFLETRVAEHRLSADRYPSDSTQYWYLQGFASGYDILALRLSSVIRELSASSVKVSNP